MKPSAITPLPPSSFAPLCWFQILSASLYLGNSFCFSCLWFPLAIYPPTCLIIPVTVFLFCSTCSDLVFYQFLVNVLYSLVTLTFFITSSLGHVDAGKSTLMGHLLYLLGNVNKRTMHKYEQESKKAGKASFAYAWVLDETGEERDR